MEETKVVESEVASSVALEFLTNPVPLIDTLVSLAPAVTEDGESFVTVGMGFAVTTTLAEPDLVESCVDMAVMAAVPVPLGVKTPELLTVPMLVGLIDHETTELKLPVPCTVAVQVDVCVVRTDAREHVTVTDVIVEAGGVLPPPPPEPPLHPDNSPMQRRKQFARKNLTKHCGRLWLPRRCPKENRSSTVLLIGSNLPTRMARSVIVPSR